MYLGTDINMQRANPTAHAPCDGLITDVDIITDNTCFYFIFVLYLIV